MGYLAHFGLTRAPFSTTPDPEFAYATKEHQLAIAKIQYVVDERQGFFLLQGDNGTGKTTISEFLLNNWHDDKGLAVAYLPNPAARTPSQFLRLLLSSYGQDSPRLQQDCWDALSGFLATGHKQGRTTVLVIDEAQTISQRFCLRGYRGEQFAYHLPSPELKLAHPKYLVVHRFLRRLP